MKLSRKIFLMLVAILAMTLIAMGAYGVNALNVFNSQFAKTFQQFGKSSNAIEKEEPFSVLMMGVDTGSAGRADPWEGNSDTMILVTVNPKTNKTTMTSLERDILVDLADGDEEENQAKLNAAYASGGTKKALQVVGDLLDIDIDYYMQVNMQGLVDLVDAVDGIEVTNNFDFPISIEANEPDYTATVEPGKHHINGDQALVYARMRYDDPEGDYGRQKRQREVIKKVTAKLLNMSSSISNYQKILKAVSSNMKTDIDLTSNNISNLLNYSDAIRNVKSYQLRGNDAEINGGSYQITDKKHLMKIQNRIKKQLGLKESTEETFKTNAILYEDIYGIEAPIEESSTSDGQETTDVDAGADGSSGQVPETYYSEEVPAEGYSDYQPSYSQSGNNQGTYNNSVQAY